MCIYVSIRELGHRYLKHAACWLPIAVLRATFAKKIAGGFSACFRAVFRQWFLSDRIHDTPVMLDLAIPVHRHAAFYFKLGNLLADGEAYRSLWTAKGAAGNVPCLLCKNVVSFDCIGSAYLVHLSCHDSRRFDPSANADIWSKADKLEAMKHDGTTKTVFDRMQMLYGLTYSPCGLLWDVELRRHVKPVEAITFDAMHATVANGIVQNETGWLLSSLKSVGITWGMVRDFCSLVDWRFCRALGSRSILVGCFAVAREEAWKSGGTFKSGASEMLLTYPVLMHFLDKVVRPRGILPDHISSFEALGSVLDLVRRGKAGEDVHAELASAVRLHALRCTEAYSSDDFKPKNHYVHHIPDHLSRDGHILDAFTGERKHGMIKQIASDILNTRAFEKSITARALCKQLDEMEDPDFFKDKLVQPEPFDALAEAHGVAAAYCARVAQLNGTRVSIGDALLIDEAVHVVAACFEIDGQMALATYRGHFAGHIAATATRWQMEAEMGMFGVGGEPPRMVEAWYYEPDGSLVALYRARV